MKPAWIRPGVIVGAVILLLLANAWEFRGKRRVLEEQFRRAEASGEPVTFLRQQALQAQAIEQLLHMIHTLLAAILAALLWN
jgi:hypothetical protein